MYRSLLAASLLCFVITVDLSEAQNETDTAPTLEEMLTIPIFPSLNGYILNLFPPRIIQFQTPLAVRYALLYVVSEYEILAACHPAALSWFGTKDDIPPTFCEPLNRRIIASYITHRVIGSNFPAEAAGFARYLSELGLTPLNKSRDKTTLNGWANVMADRLVNFFSTDGFNSLGDATRTDFRQQYSDQTGYQPVNPAFLPPDKLRHPLRWQPLTGEKDGRGDFFSQVHVTPQLASAVTPLVISREDFLSRTVPSPYENPNKRGAISAGDEKTVRKLVRKLFKLSEQTTAEMIAQVYWWDNKFLSLGTFIDFYRRNMIINDTTTAFRLALGDMMAQHDGILLAWKEKVRHDLVRPTTIIRRLLKGKLVKAFRGVGKGAGLVKAEEWEPVIPVQPHSEFPSASAALCKASLGHLKFALADLFRNTTLPPFQTVLTPFTNPLSPVTTPIPVKFASFDVAIRECGRSRLDGGVHFQPSVSAGFRLTRGIGKEAYLHVSELLAGRVPKNCARCIAR